MIGSFRLHISWLLGGFLAALFAWWAWKQGAYFGTVFYPGALAVFGLIAIIAIVGTTGRWTDGVFGVAFGALGLLAALTAFSTLWSDVPSAGIEYGMRVFLYAAIFYVGWWFATSCATRTGPLVPVATAGGVAGIATVIALFTSEDLLWLLHDDATLRFPIGYRNANAAFFLICLWPAVILAADAGRSWIMRSLASGGIVLLANLAILAQSRASVPAAVIACVVLIAVARNRLRIGVVLLLAAIPIVSAMPTLLDVYSYGEADAGVLTLLQTAAETASVSALGGAVIGAIAFGVVEPRLSVGAIAKLWMGRIALAVVVIGAAGAGAFYIADQGGPNEFIDERIGEFTSGEYPDLRDQGVRFGSNVESNRSDFWRVSLDAGAQAPVVGQGAGSFEPIYLRERSSPESPQDPHSIQMLLWSELGFAGVALFTVFFVVSVMAALARRAEGMTGAIASAAVLAAGAQWLVQASVDWLWQYPGVTVPVIFLFGAAAARTIGAAGGYEIGSRFTRFGLAAGAAVLAIAVVPLFLSERYANRAAERQDEDVSGAVADYQRSADLFPMDPDPLVDRAHLQFQAGQNENALVTLREALEREPGNFGAHYLLAEILIERGETSHARVALARARELSPTEPAIAELQESLQQADESS